MYNTIFVGHDRMVCELTVRAGKVVYDLDGLTGDPWDAAPSAGNRQSRRWSTLGERGFGTGRRVLAAGRNAQCAVAAASMVAVPPAAALGWP